jgi:hypothetical protein
VGTTALCANTTGSFNTALGHLAGSNITTQVNTISVGCNAQTSGADNHTVWGNSSNNLCNCIYTAWSNVSDCRDKANIKSLSPNLGLNLLRKIEPVSFNWDHRDVYVQKCSYEYGQKDGTLVGDKEHYGIIAQNLREALDELNEKFDGLGYDADKDAYRITYEELIAPIIRAIKELDERLTDVENKF